MDPGFPRKIHLDWPSIVGKVDAAFELSGNRLFYTVSVFSVKHFPLESYACFSQQAVFTSSADPSHLSSAIRKDVCCTLWTLMLGLAAKSWKTRRKTTDHKYRKEMFDWLLCLRSNVKWVYLYNIKSYFISFDQICQWMNTFSQIIDIFNIFENNHCISMIDCIGFKLNAHICVVLLK